MSEVITPSYRKLENEMMYWINGKPCEVVS